MALVFWDLFCLSLCVMKTLKFIFSTGSLYYGTASRSDCRYRFRYCSIGCVLSRHFSYCAHKMLSHSLFLNLFAGYSWKCFGKDYSAAYTPVKTISVALCAFSGLTRCFVYEWLCCYVFFTHLYAAYVCFNAHIMSMHFRKLFSFGLIASFNTFLMSYFLCLSL